jgi:hypothetical protein
MVFSPNDGVMHQFLHFHTLLVGGLVGLLTGAIMYVAAPLRTLCEKGMFWMGLTYRASLKKMLLAGLLGAWFHVAIDSIHHMDVQVFWPFFTDNPVNSWFSGRFNQYAPILRECVVRGCLLSWSMLFVTYGLLLNIFRVKTRLAARWRFRRLSAANHQLAAD